MNYPLIPFLRILPQTPNLYFDYDHDSTTLRHFPTDGETQHHINKGGSTSPGNHQNLPKSPLSPKEQY